MILTKMKTQSIFFLLIFLLIGITYCVKEDPSPDTTIPPDSEEEALPPDKDSIDNPVLDSTSIEPQVTAQMGLVNCTGARVFFDILNNGDHPVINKGVYWGTTKNPATANPDSTSICYTEEVNSAKGRFMSEIEQLQPATPYFVRAYVITRSDTIYSKDLSFTTNAPPTITTAEVTGVTATTAIAGGNVTTTGNSYVVERGICYSKAYNPVAYEDDPYIEQEVQSAEGTGEFSVTLTGLIPNTRYHVRSFVGVATGFSYGDQLIVYGDEVQFTTDALDSIDNPGQDPVTPEVVANLFSFNCNGAIVFFNLLNADENPVVDAGVYWGTTENPNTSNPGNSISYTEVWNTMDGKGFRSQIDQLQPGTLYHIRAYITTTSDTYYSEDIWFITNPPPTITTSEVTEVTATTAIAGGNVTSTGNSFVVERGICYSKHPNPVAYGIDPYIEQEVQSTEGTGVFTIPLAGLTPDTRYYVRSFVGVATGVEYGDQLFVYGDEVEFITQPL